MSVIALLLLCLSVLSGSFAQVFDNELSGPPLVECGAGGFSVNIETKYPFNGQVYVKGHYDDPDCRNDQHGIRAAGINLNFNSCRIQRLRSLEPRGVQVTSTIVVTFHHKFVTKNDKAFMIRCFYMEAEKALGAELDVSAIPTDMVTTLAPMPSCTYQVLDGPEGRPLQHVVVGQRVYHKWECQADLDNLYCMTVHSCSVDDGNGDTVQLLDGDGCAQDHYLLENLDYMTDTMAGQNAIVFKYADRPQLYFTCSIDIAVKEPNLPCARATCDNPRLLIFFKRSRRSAEVDDSETKESEKQDEVPYATVDVAVSLEASGLTDTTELEFETKRTDEICVSSFVFTMTIVSVSGSLFVACTVGTTFIMLRRKWL